MNCFTLDNEMSVPKTKICRFAKSEESSYSRMLILMHVCMYCLCYGCVFVGGSVGTFMCVYIFVCVMCVCAPVCDVCSGGFRGD